MVSLDTPSAVQIQIYFYFALAPIVVLCYDFALTFSMEVERFWSRPPFSLGASLFYLNRYLTLLGHLPVLLGIFFTSNDPSRKAKMLPLSSFRQYFAVIVQVIVGTLLLMRTHALYSRSVRILAFLVTTEIVGIIIGAWAISKSRDNTRLPDAAPKLGCTDSLTEHQSLYLAIAWIGVLSYDAVIFGLTLYKALTLYSAARNRGRSSLVNILLRDGSIYFAILTIVNLSNILTFLLAPPLLRGVCTTITNVLASTMISRLMLNLRNPNLGDTTNTDLDTVGVRRQDTATSLRFSTLPNFDDGGSDGRQWGIMRTEFSNIIES